MADVTDTIVGIDDPSQDRTAGPTMLSWELTADGIAVGDYWGLPVPERCTLVLFEMEMELPGGDTIQPLLHVEEGGAADEFGFVVQAAAADTYHRIQDEVRIHTSEGTLWIDPQLVGAVTHSIGFRVCIRVGWD
jgi:hypothetical protein